MEQPGLAREAHNLEVGGSNPPPAIFLFLHISNKNLMKKGTIISFKY